MKKTALLLAVVMLLGLFVLAGCATTPAESSVEPAPASSEEPAPASSEEPVDASSEEPVVESSEEEPVVESSEEEPVVESSEEEPVVESSEDAGNQGGADPSTVTTSKDVSKVSGDNLALGATVKGVSINGSNPAYCADLTDGVATSIVSYDNNWFGLYYQDGKDDLNNVKDGEAKIVVDLGELKSIGVIRANFFLGNTSGIQAPDSVKIEVSEDGKKYVSLGKQDVAGGEEGSGTCGWIGYSLAENINAQYIRLTIKVRGVWTFLNEIEVY
ncbi:MAG: hypothetical protein J5843_03875 [Clostridia bacterium]|nr:hypothetical protein [Clostridia bacterium]